MEFEAALETLEVLSQNWRAKIGIFVMVNLIMIFDSNNSEQPNGVMAVDSMWQVQCNLMWQVQCSRRKPYGTGIQNVDHTVSVGHLASK